MIELDWTAEIVVTDHACRRCRERLGWDDRNDIRTEVRLALVEGRIAERRPNWTRGNAAVDDLPLRSLFVWNATTTRCWVVAPNRLGTIYVKTLLLESDTEARLAQEKRFRTGYTAT